MTSFSLESLQDKLLKAKLLTKSQIGVISEEKRATQKPFLQLVIELGFVNSSQLKQFIADTYRATPFSLQNIEINQSLLKQFPRQLAELHQIFPFQCNEEGLHVAMADINDFRAYDTLRHYFHLTSIVPYVATPEEILKVIEQNYGQLNLFETILKEFQAFAHDSTIPQEDALPIRFVDALISEALKEYVSDIHFEPKDAYMSIRFRCDGILNERCMLHARYWSAILTRLKIISGMNIAESRLPQVGRFSMKIGGRAVDFRASSHPTCHGESFVIRILDRFQSLLDLEELGFFPDQISLLKEQVKRPEGLIILTGPTGSGKTTTLYSMLSYLSSKELNIMTLEDPIEYELPQVRQTQVDEMIGLTFVEGVRSILRQDPDVVLIGEIRDEGTARMALRAAMTGHLVLTTLHTNDALGAASRLIDLGVPAPLLSGNINCIIAQRLVRRLCAACKKPTALPNHLKPLLNIPVENERLIYEAVGCQSCHYKGYQGRIAIAEILPIGTQLDELLISQRARKTLIEGAQVEGFTEILSNAKRLVLEGVTSLQEIERVVYIDHKADDEQSIVSL